MKYSFIANIYYISYKTVFLEENPSVRTLVVLKTRFRYIKISSNFNKFCSKLYLHQVNYFDEPAALDSVESRNIKAFKDEVYLPCAVFDSSPVVDVYW